MPAAPAIALLTDYGAEDGYMGVMKGVALGIAPGVPLVDLSHEIPPQDVPAGAWVLHTSWHYFPAGTIFLCVVDPGVGGARRAVALRAGGRYFVGPDNGLFSRVLDAAPPEAVVSLENSRYHLPAPSATFHGRDIFAPCAAHLAAGVPLEDLGTPVAPESLVRLPAPQPAWHGDLLAGTVVHVDHFGNLITSLGPPLADAVLAAPATSARLGGHVVSARARTFAAGPAGDPFLLRDSSGHLAIAVRDGSAARRLGVARGAEVLIVGLDAGSAGVPAAPRP